MNYNLLLVIYVPIYMLLKHLIKFECSLFGLSFS